MRPAGAAATQGPVAPLMCSIQIAWQCTHTGLRKMWLCGCVAAGACCTGRLGPAYRCCKGARLDGVFVPSTVAALLAWLGSVWRGVPSANRAALNGRAGEDVSRSLVAEGPTREDWPAWWLASALSSTVCMRARLLLVRSACGAGRLGVEKSKEISRTAANTSQSMLDGVWRGCRPHHWQMRVDLALLGASRCVMESARDGECAMYVVVRACVAHGI